ncbi:MAG: UvrD-helicase domain-containing protein, partial [Oscillospiraceae bacterium]|nr:UvrD-helicase domain-containing protein [Oscillospiraceae bacterium]
ALEAYKKAVRDKILLHREHRTTLLYTFSSYKDRRPIEAHLKEQLEKAGFELRPRSNREIMEKLVASEENRYIRGLVTVICRFISNFKTNGYTADDFQRMYRSTQNVRDRLFLTICHDCYVDYQRYLKENQAVDFQDMINESARILREAGEMKQKLDFRYIIVDEYQDISRQRFDLVSALREVTSAKIIAVGDDWQSIYAFSGSDITLFTRFREKMGYAALLKIVRTYRNSQEVIDIAGSFIKKNKEQIQKDLISPKHIKDPVIIYTYDSRKKDPKGDNRSGANYALAHAVEVALEQIMEYNRAEGKPVQSPILLLGRFNFDGDRLEKSGLFEYVKRGKRLRSVRYPRLSITFMTAHAAKGLGYDNVIVINGKNETYGFPSKIENDPVLSFVIREDLSIQYAEERRLFYVAMTRTKNRVFFIAPEENPSEFLLELKHDYRNVVLKGSWNEEPPMRTTYKKPCPMCGYPMQYRYKAAYGLRLYICTNDPEVCGFMTNNPAAGKLSIVKCDQCRDGYLIVKPGKENNSFFLGCTNYKKDGSGCSRAMNRTYYYECMHIRDDTPALPVVIPKGADIEPEKKSAASSSDERPVTDIQVPDIKPVGYHGYDLNQTLGTILGTLSEISRYKYFGATVLTDVLRGSESKKILENHLEQANGYGKLAGIAREDVRFLVEWLIRNGFILRTKGQYPVLHPTYNGEHYGEVISSQKLHALKRKLEDTETGIAADADGQPERKPVTELTP